MTRWLPVVGSPGYEVSDHGDVKSWHRNTKIGRILKQSPDHDGYPSVGLYDSNRVRKTTKVATIVALAFLGSRPAGLVVRHLDGDKNNSSVDNLAYGTVAENIQDQMLHGTHRQTSKTHCPRQHPLTGDNLVKRKGKIGRECKTCHRDRQRERERRKRDREAMYV